MRLMRYTHCRAQLRGGGVYSNVRLDDQLCRQVVNGVTAHCRKELSSGKDGHQELAGSWYELLAGRRAHGLT